MLNDKQLKLAIVALALIVIMSFFEAAIFAVLGFLFFIMYVFVANALSEQGFLAPFTYPENNKKLLVILCLALCGSSLSPALHMWLWLKIALPFIALGMAGFFWYVYDPLIEYLDQAFVVQEEDETYIAWIKSHEPSLPPKAKEAYIQASREIVDSYYRERLAWTMDDLVKTRRERETIKPLGEVQSELFERYRTLASEIPRPDGFPPFPLFPPNPKLAQALQKLKAFPYYPWNMKENPFDKIEVSPIRNGTKRFEGTFILAPSGSGKTTLLNYLIDQDFTYLTFKSLKEKVPVSSEISIIAMDSTGDFIKSWLPMPHFKTDGVFIDRLIIIEPDVEHPIALNPFAFGRARMKGSARDREKMANTTIELLTHAFSTMGEGAKFTPRQALLFRHCVRLCLAIPNSNLQTLANILSKASVTDHAEHIASLDEAAISFFQHEFPTTDFKKVCSEVSWRLSALLENPTFAKMMNAPECKVDFFDALNNSSFILINTDRALLGDERSAIFGRLMLSLVRIAMRERDTIPEDQRRPVYFYIDEAHEIFDNDTQVASMIDDVRKSRLALTFVTQRLAKIKDANVKDALLSCAILLARPTPEDAITVARYMNTDTDYVKGLPERTFMLSARGVTRATQVQVPHYQPDTARHLSAHEQRLTKELVRRKYGYIPKPSSSIIEAPKSKADLRKAERTKKK